MTLVRFKDLVIDANDTARLASFWASALGLEVELFDDGDAKLSGSRPSETVWINAVSEVKKVKHRVHLDVVANSLEAFAGCEQLSADGEFEWTVFADPEGGEFCVFVVDESREFRLKDVGVDAINPTRIATWWQKIWGGTLVHDHEYSYIDDVPDAPFESIDFAPVPESKAVKNRLHWDVTLTKGHTVDDLVDAGATILKPAGDGIPWTVMADPEGNEFCAFPPV